MVCIKRRLAFAFKCSLFLCLLVFVGCKKAKSYTKKELEDSLVTKAKDSNNWTGRCVRVSDGDEIVVLNLKGEEVRVRLAEVTAPRLSAPFGLEAKEFVETKILGEIVSLRNVGRHSDGDVLAYVREPDSDLYLDDQLVKEGLGWTERESAFIGLFQIEAQKKRIGIWSHKGEGKGK